MAPRTPAQLEAIEWGWNQGELSWKLRQHQKPLYATLDATDALILAIRCARRFGKTLTVLLWLIEQSIKRPGLIVRYAAPTEKSLRKYVQPNLRVLLQDCPSYLLPKWVTQDSLYLWPNGSEWHLAGTDKEHVEKLRGPRTDIAVCDEAGSMDRLKYVVNDVLMPSTLDAMPEGRILVVSTPPPTPDHDFTAICAEAKADGHLLQFTVEDNLWLQSRPALLEKYAKAMGGRESSTWRREMLCEDVVDETIAICPEFTPEVEAGIVVAQERPPFWQAYEAMDPGFSPSHCGVLFGYYDFAASRLVIEDEVELKQMRTDVLATTLKNREKDLWGETTPVPHRWSDIEPLLLADLQALHGMKFSATGKDHLETMVNKVRIWVKQDRLRIHPRCQSLAAQLRVGVFNKARTEFDWSARFGHYDLLAALVYMVRNCPEHINPYPLIPVGVTSPTHFIPANLFKPTGTEATLAHLFAIQPKRVRR